ncbi:MAG TPA: hypothetical protein PK156_04565 [Polyangium sp.]|nr:hypothetical protein [Polyangium sp.]
MRLVQANSSGSTPHTSSSFGAQFIALPRKAEMLGDLRGRGYIVASVSRPSAVGRLRQVIEEAVESALAMRGAPPPSVPVDVDMATSLRDQLKRTQGLGATGLALVLPPLGALTEGESTLNLMDSAVLAAFGEAAQTGAVALVFDDADRGLRILAPVRLDEFVADAIPTRRPMVSEARSIMRPTQAADGPETIEAQSVLEQAQEPANVPALPAPAPVPAPARAAAPAPMNGRLRVRPVNRPTEPPPSSPSTVVDLDCRPEAEVAPVHESLPLPLPPPVPTAQAAVMPRQTRASSLPPGAAAKRTVRGLSPQDIAARAEMDVPPAKPTHVSDTLPPPPPLPADLAPLHSSPPPNPSSLERVLTSSEWRAFAMDLDAAKGPKPAGVIDRLFATRYMPLLGALARGQADGAVQKIVDGFRTSFEHSYTEGFAAIRATGKRPVMVLDVAEVAARIARLNNARAVRLLLVDSMRFDLGERVMSRLKPMLQGRAVCVDRTLLWSALPTTTQVQSMLLARGAEGLREPLPEMVPEPEVIRGRSLATVRRERLGNKDIFKIDVVEARLRGVGPSFDERLGGIADETSQVVAKFVEASPARTLVFMFGDHGFRMNSDSRGTTSSATQGGGSPEEVLVPGYAWLVGGVH